MCELRKDRRKIKSTKRWHEGGTRVALMGDKVDTPVIYDYMAVRMGRNAPFFMPILPTSPSFLTLMSAFFGLGHILDVLTKVRSI